MQPPISSAQINTNDQIPTATLSGVTTNGTQTELYVNGLSGEQLGIDTDTTWGFDIMIVARRTDADNESAFYMVRGAIDNNAGTTALVNAVDPYYTNEDTAAWSVLVDADVANDALRVRVTGEAAKTISWVAKVQIVDVTG